MSSGIRGLTRAPTYAAILRKCDTNLACPWMAPLRTLSICPFLMIFIALLPLMGVPSVDRR
jgi:hypothetical protein